MEEPRADGALDATQVRSGQTGAVGCVGQEYDKTGAKVGGRSTLFEFEAKRRPYFAGPQSGAYWDGALFITAYDANHHDTYLRRLAR